MATGEEGINLSFSTCGLECFIFFLCKSTSFLKGSSPQTFAVPTSSFYRCQICISLISILRHFFCSHPCKANRGFFASFQFSKLPPWIWLSALKMNKGTSLLLLTPCSVAFQDLGRRGICHKGFTFGDQTLGNGISVLHRASLQACNSQSAVSVTFIACSSDSPRSTAENEEEAQHFPGDMWPHFLGEFVFLSTVHLAQQLPKFLSVTK